MKNFLLTLLLVPICVQASTSADNSRTPTPTPESVLASAASDTSPRDQSAQSSSTISGRRRTLGDYVTVSFTREPARPHDLDSALTVNETGEQVDDGLAVPLDNEDTQFMMIERDHDGNLEVFSADQVPGLTVEQVIAAKSSRNLKASPADHNLVDTAFRKLATLTANAATSHAAQQVVHTARTTMDATNTALAQGRHQIGLGLMNITRRMQQQASASTSGLPASSTSAAEAEDID